MNILELQFWYKVRNEAWKGIQETQKGCPGEEMTETMLAMMVEGSGMGQLCDSEH